MKMLRFVERINRNYKIVSYFFHKVKTKHFLFINAFRKNFINTYLKNNIV